MPLPNCIGRKRLWTRERTMSALLEAAKEIKGPLPCSERAWNQIKKWRLDWPPAKRILEYFRDMARAWLAIGAGMRRVSLKYLAWTPEEDSYLLDNAGNFTLDIIAFKLGRSYSAVRARLNRHFHIASRHNQGYLSAAELSKEFLCPYHRVRAALVEGVINGRFDRKRNRWQIDLANLTPEAKELLTRPKLHSHKNSPPDLGDYRKRHGLRRQLIDGRVMAVAGGNR